MSASHDSGTSDDDACVALLRERNVTIRYSKSGRVLILDASGGRLDSSDLAALAGVPRLKELHLSGCEIDDQIVPWLLKLPRLQVIDLQQTRVSDRIFESIAHLSQLKLLDVSNTEVSQDTVRQMRKRLIKTRIVYL